jgi:hypothetical protein
LRKDVKSRKGCGASGAEKKENQALAEQGFQGDVEYMVNPSTPLIIPPTEKKF